MGNTIGKPPSGPPKKPSRPPLSREQQQAKEAAKREKIYQAGRQRQSEKGGGGKPEIPLTPEQKRAAAERRERILHNAGLNALANYDASPKEFSGGKLPAGLWLGQAVKPPK